MNNKLKIEEAHLVDFCMKLQQAVLDGYRFSEVGDEAPCQIGWVFHAILEQQGNISYEGTNKLVDEVSLKLTLDVEEALEGIQKIAQETEVVQLSEEQQEKAVEVVKKQINVAAKQRGRPTKG